MSESYKQDNRCDKGAIWHQNKKSKCPEQTKACYNRQIKLKIADRNQPSNIPNATLNHLKCSLVSVSTVIGESSNSPDLVKIKQLVPGEEFQKPRVTVLLLDLCISQKKKKKACWNSFATVYSYRLAGLKVCGTVMAAEEYNQANFPPV